MKLTFFIILSLILLILGAVFSQVRAQETAVIFEDDFESYEESITNWQTGSNVYLQHLGGVNNSQCVKVEVTGGGTAPYFLDYLIDQENLSEIYVRFNFKFDSDNPAVTTARGGIKFLKLFGRLQGYQNYANTTFILNYHNGSFFDLGYGNGDGLENDSNNTIRYNGSISHAGFDPLVVIEASSDTFVPVFDRWYSFEAQMKYSSNTDQNPDLRDGVYRVWIDDQLLIHATNVKNRHNDNFPYFSIVGLAGFVNPDQFNLGNGNWNLYYDNVVISTEPIGSSGLIETDPCFFGDIDCNGFRDTQDLRLSLNLFLGSQTNQTYLNRADLNQDNQVNILDIQQLINLILNL